MTANTALAQRRAVKMVGTGYATTHQSSLKRNRMANERKKDSWQAKGNVLRLVDEQRTQNGLFTAKEDGRRQLNVVDKHMTCPMAEQGLLKEEEEEYECLPPSKYG